MSDAPLRQSAWSKVMIAQWLEEAQCPNCPTANLKGQKAMIELHPDGQAVCSCCGKVFDAVNR